MSGDAPAGGRRADRRLAWLVVAVAGLGLVVLGALLIPWHWLPGGRSLTPVRPDQVMTAGQLERVTAYSSMQRTLSLTSYAVSLVVSLLLGLTRFGGAAVGRLPGRWWLQVPVGALGLLAVGELVTLPFGLRLHANAVRAGLSTQGVAGWLRDDVVTLGVSTVYAALGALVVIGLARRAPRLWPALAGVLAGLLVLLGSFVYPVLVEPLFNSFTPLPAGPLRTSIAELARKEHVKIDDVLVADASRRTTTLNAYVTGFGGTRRVVLYDNTVHDLPQAQTEAIVAHELGHAEHDDVLTGTVLGALGAAFGVGLLALLVSSPGLLRRAGANGPGDPRVLALLLALTATGTFLADPVENAASRAIEARADRTGLLATRDPAAFVAMQKRLALQALSEPAPPAFVQYWFGTHPTTEQRIGMAETMRPELRR